MKKGVSLFSLLVLVFTTRSQSVIDVLHYRYELELSDKTDSIKGKASITVKFLNPTDNLSLDFVLIKNGKQHMLTYATTTIDEKKVVQVKSNDEELRLQLAKPAKAGDIETFIISYKGIPNDGLIISKNKYGHRTFFADNWPDRAHYWIPCKDDPADKASVEFIITAPEHYQVVANGIQVEETNITKGLKRTHWKEDEPLATKVMTIGVADFAVNMVGFVNNCIPVYSWGYPENGKEAVHDFSLTKDILSFYINTIGPYGYKKLANVQSKTRFGGLENASAIFYAEDKITGDGSNESLLAHEIAHQWFGNMATEKSFAHLWLSEGFATYFTTLFFENKYGKAKAAAMRDEDREQVIAFTERNNTPVVNTAETDFMNLLNENNYQKGGWILHMLRQQLGDSVFKKSIRKYYAAYAGKNADTEDLQKIIEEVSGKNLTQFFKQWLYTPGIPKLDIKWKYNSKEKNISVTVKQLQQTPFSFPLEIGYQSGQVVNARKMLNISKQSETFKIPMAQKPSELTADPDVNLLFKGNIAEEK
ncbi:MAG: M1 family metallopeptidase [Bacteroidetes bacterium]|nr:MAG: M1 family metallopeptidase [Bacteroidota bacterium]